MNFNILYVDPPWQYHCYDKSDAAHGAATSHYPTMQFKDLISLPISDITDTNCAIFLWVTDPCLPEGLQLLDAWGFRFVTIGFYWVKLNKNGSPWFGLGHYTRGNPEICLLGLKGRLKRIDRAVPKLIMSQRGEHSAKPPEARDRIVRLYGDLPRLEVFGREQTDGWMVIGDEIDGLDIRDSLKNLIAS
ncbi:MAG: MT-A70 family methyltransferase [Caulobacteraceae bacterium]